MIRSVLVAGIHVSDNQFVNYVEDLWLKCEHLERVSVGKSIPSKYDAAIICVNQSSHDMYHRVKAVYDGKPVFVATKGVSSIKEDFERDVFGGDDVLKKIREIPLERFRHHQTFVPISLRAWWLLCNFVEVGATVRQKDIVTFFEKFLVKGQESAISNMWHKGRTMNCLTDLAPGSAIFTGITTYIKNMMLEYELPFPEDITIMKQSAVPAKSNVSELKKTSTPLQPETVETFDQKETDVADPQPVSAPASDPGVDLLLEAMTHQQDEIRQLKDLVNQLTDSVARRIPMIIQDEIRGISRLFGSLVPKLQGLDPDQIQKVDQMLELFLSMRRA